MMGPKLPGGRNHQREDSGATAASTGTSPSSSPSPKVTSGAPSAVSPSTRTARARSCSTHAVPGEPARVHLRQQPQQGGPADRVDDGDVQPAVGGSAARADRIPPP